MLTASLPARAEESTSTVSQGWGAPSTTDKKVQGSTERELLPFRPSFCGRRTTLLEQLEQSSSFAGVLPSRQRPFFLFDEVDVEVHGVLELGAGRPIALVDRAVRHWRRRKHTTQVTPRLRCSVQPATVCERGAEKSPPSRLSRRMRCRPMLDDLTSGAVGGRRNLWCPRSGALHVIPALLQDVPCGT